MNRDRRMRDIAEGQYGLISRSQALAIGFTDRTIEFRLRSGMWDRVVPGVYGLPGRIKDRRSWLAAATLSLPGAVVSHQSAGTLHEIPGLPDLVVVTVPFRTTHSFPGVIVHRSTDLTGPDVVAVDGLPVTTLLRTVIDLASVLHEERLIRVVDYCLSSRRLALEGLQTGLEAIARRGKRGVRSLRKILDERGPGWVAPESELERLALQVLAAGGMPEPQRQFAVPWRSPQGERVDFAYPHQRLIIEVDGRRWHSRDLDFENDRRRDNLAMLAGWRVLRFTWRELREKPTRVCSMVRRALSTGGSGTPPGPASINFGR